jgi:D-xylose 1-dehydrogenase (NADP+, D-xylono-1,5-lactone-forming)
MEKILNWGLLSTARINRALIKPLRASKRTRLLAVASRGISSAESYAREWDIPRAHGSYEALLADPEIDVIYNSLPNHLHAEWTIKALQAGKHVLCEKPLALSLDEVDAMIRASQESGNVLAEAFMYRHHPQTLKGEGTGGWRGIGKITAHQRRVYIYVKPRRELSQLQGNGRRQHLGCGLLSHLVCADARRGGACRSKRLAGGRRRRKRRVIHWTDAVRGRNPCAIRQRIQIPIPRAYRDRRHGGGAGHPQPVQAGGKSDMVLRHGDGAETIKIKGQELYLGEVEDMCDAVLTGKARIPLSDSRGNIAAILGLLESARDGRNILL